MSRVGPESHQRGRQCDRYCDRQTQDDQNHFPFLTPGLVHVSHLIYWRPIGGSCHNQQSTMITTTSSSSSQHTHYPCHNQNIDRDIISDALNNQTGKIKANWLSISLIQLVPPNIYPDISILTCCLCDPPPPGLFCQSVGLWGSLSSLWCQEFQGGSQEIQAHVQMTVLLFFSTSPGK